MKRKKFAAKPCLECKEETNNFRFCSQKCLMDNRRKKEKKKYYCKYCNILISIGYNNNIVCKKCNHNSVDWSTITINILKNKLPTFQFHARIRALARSIYKKSGKPLHCSRCNYRNHFEICHIKPIKDFNDNDSIASINDLSNLICLCPNCHWDLDHGFLIL